MTPSLAEPNLGRRDGTFRHQAFIYHADDQFIGRITEFAREGRPAVSNGPGWYLRCPLDRTRCATDLVATVVQSHPSGVLGSVDHDQWDEAEESDRRLEEMFGRPLGNPPADAISGTYNGTKVALVRERDVGHIHDPRAGWRVPDPDREGGRGLYQVNQLCDLVQLRSWAGGPELRLTMWR
jgi:hypothetical protein